MHGTGANADGTGQLVNKGKRALVVEDEAIVAFDLEDMLTDLGFDEVVVCNSFDAAEEVLGADTSFDLAMFDLNLNGVISVPLIETARAAGIPSVVTSGYEEAVISLQDMAVPRIVKPYGVSTIQTAIEGLVRSVPDAASADIHID